MKAEIDVEMGDVGAQLERLKDEIPLSVPRSISCNNWSGGDKSDTPLTPDLPFSLLSLDDRRSSVDGNQVGRIRVPPSEASVQSPHLTGHPRTPPQYLEQWTGLFEAIQHEGAVEDLASDGLPISAYFSDGAEGAALRSGVVSWT